RFGIIVEPEFEAEAISIVRNMSGQGNRARVIQGDKARKDLEKLQDSSPNSITHIMCFAHATAEAYINASYGNVQRVENARELKNTRRASTKDGMGSGNYAMYRCDMPESELVFGQGARERALEAKRNEFHDLVTEWQAAGQQAEEVQELLLAVDKLKPIAYAESLQAMLNAQTRIQAIDAKLQQLDLSDTTALEAELAELNQRLQAQNAQYTKLNNLQVDCRAELKLADNLCHKLDAEQDKNL